MSNTLLSSVRRMGVSSAESRSPWIRGLFALALIAGVTALKPAAFAQCTTSVGAFEIDGNTACGTQGCDPQPGLEDWACLSADTQNTPFTDPTGSNDNRVSGKWNDPTTFRCATQSAPNKDDITAGDVAFRTLNGDQFVYVDWTRVFGNGSAFVSYVFSQSTATYPAASCIPERSNGDIVINYFFTQGGAVPTIKAQEWIGDAFSGHFVDLPTGSFGNTFAAQVSGPNPLYGEGALNLTETIGNIDCSRFSSVYIMTRSSAEDNANLADITVTKPVGSVLCDDEQFCTIDTCSPGAPGADPTTGCLHSPNPCHENPDVNCTIDTCDEVNDVCVHNPDDTVCGASDQCVTHTCDPNSGCTTTDTSGRCGTSDQCTDRGCDPSSGCFANDTSARCGTSDQCTDRGCNPSSGCFANDTSGRCGASDQCTTRGCDTSTGCFSNDTSGRCGTSDQCTTRGCNPATGCTSTDTSGRCGTSDQCTNRGCNPSSGCTTTDTSGRCGTSDQCTDRGCDPTTGCTSTDTSGRCNDDINCTDDRCDPVTGCANTPDDTKCNDDRSCTSDVCDPSSGCVITPVNSRCTDVEICSACSLTGPPPTGCVPINVPGTQTASSDSRAYGVSAVLLGSTVIAPTPDSNVTNPQTLIPISIPSVADVNILHVEESGGGATGSSSATATTADVSLLGGAITATSVKAVSSCSASNSTAGCDLDGSVLQDVIVNGDNLGTIKEPTTITIVDPILQTTTIVNLLEKKGSGANAGNKQPEPSATPGGAGTNTADLTVNGIHVSVVRGILPNPPFGDPFVDIVVAHADAKAAFSPVCAEQPHVSGRGFVVGVVVDEDAIDSTNTLLTTTVAQVDLPSTGGSDDATALHVGPLSGSGTTLIESNTAFSHTSGTAGDPATSSTHSEVQKLVLIDNGTPGTNPFLGADLVTADCTSSASGATGSSAGGAQLVNLTLGGQDVCDALGLSPSSPCANDAICCQPPPNTDACAALSLAPLCSGLGLSITLNEQKGSTSGNPTDITVNAIHITLGGPVPPGTGADIIISSAHCDAGTP